MNLKELQNNYIKNQLIPKIISQLQDEELQATEVEHAGGLDGFMSALYNIKLITTKDKETITRLLIAKFMKGDETFRLSSKSYIQFANEIHIYGKVLPEYQELLEETKFKDFTVDDLAPHTYVAEYGYIEGLSLDPTQRESVLVLQNLKTTDYKLGARLYLNLDHLLLMSKVLGRYHALSYALRELHPLKYEQLKSDIVPLPFVSDNDKADVKQNLYYVLYRAAFDRFFDFCDRHRDSNMFDKQSEEELKMLKHLERIRKKYFANPTQLLERIRTQVEDNEEDRRFAAILHGDFNRNNVLFRYKSKESGDNELNEAEDIKMIDFQELRFGTTAIDIAFFMYFNTPESIRSESWMDILREYHRNMWVTLERILKANKKTEQDLQAVEQELKKYSFEHFYAHFKRYAFYGVMICLHFLPWILCSEEECARLSFLFESDMQSEEFHRLSIEAGGDEVNKKLLNIVRHASRMGYMDQI